MSETKKFEIGDIVRSDVCDNMVGEIVGFDNCCRDIFIKIGENRIFGRADYWHKVGDAE